jgi:hypothetical protein
MNTDRNQHESIAASGIRHAGIVMAMLLLTSFASTGTAQAPAALAGHRTAGHEHLQGLLWLHSPDYLLVSTPATTPPDASPRTTINEHSNH